MTSKSFKGLLAANELNVVGYDDSSQVDLLIRRSDRAITSTGIAITPSDAPALALAILEAAGVAESSDAGVAANYLRLHISEQERATAEAKEQAELEAEALDYWKAFHKAPELASFDDIQWSDLMPETQAKWLAVARRAREMRNEKKEPTND